jgi:hypothetical protein
MVKEKRRIQRSKYRSQNLRNLLITGVEKAIELLA